MSDTPDPSTSNIVSTHQHQWNQHLASTGMNDDAFAAYRNSTAQSMGAMSYNMGCQSWAGGAGGQSMGAMSYNMGGLGGMSYNQQQQQRLYQQQQQQQYYPQNYVNPNINNSSGAGSATNVVELQNVDEDKEIDPMKGRKITQRNSHADSRTGSIDYGLDGNNG